MVSGAILLGALITSVPFCRWLCPLAAVMNPLSRFGLFRVRRNEEACLSCGRCEAVCPMQIPVNDMTEVRSARCTSCLSCVSVCPAEEDGALQWGLPGALGGQRWPQTALVVILILAIGLVVTGAYAFPLASFVKVRGEAPAATAVLELQVEGVACRGTATRLYFFLTRDDLDEVPGYLKLEAWPGPGPARVRITYDPEKTRPDAIQQAVTTPYFNELQNVWDNSPFQIQGYEPWAVK